MSQCPDYPASCRNGSAAQRNLVPAEQAQLLGRAAEVAADAEICTYCGLVYVRFPPPAARVGTLDSAMAGSMGFKPFKGWG